jgi:hypothetical protein
MGGLAVLAAAIVFADNSLRDAQAQESALQNQTDQAVPADRAEPAQPSQLQSQPRSEAQARSADPNKQHWRTSELIGMNVRGKTGNDAIGEITDAMIGPDGRVIYVAVSFGGFLGLGEKLFAVPWEAVQFVREGEEKDDVYARIDVTEQQLRQKRGFNSDRWPTQADESFFQEGSRPPRQVERPVPPTRDQNVPR